LLQPSLFMFHHHTMPQSIQPYIFYTHELFYVMCTTSCFKTGVFNLVTAGMWIHYMQSLFNLWSNLIHVYDTVLALIYVLLKFQCICHFTCVALKGKFLNMAL
jgi:hypothetical protein